MGQQSIISRVQTRRSDSLGGASSLGLFELVPPLVTAGASVCVSQRQHVQVCMHEEKDKLEKKNNDAISAITPTTPTSHETFGLVSAVTNVIK